MSEKSLKKYIKTLTALELKEEILKLHQKLTQVKTYYKAELSTDGSKVYMEYAKKLDREIKKLYNVKFSGYRTTELNKIIKEYETIATYKQDFAKILLYRVEQCLLFVNNYYVIDLNYVEALYKHILKALEYAKINNCIQELHPEIEMLFIQIEKCNLLNKLSLRDKLK